MLFRSGAVIGFIRNQRNKVRGGRERWLSRGLGGGDGGSGNGQIVAHGDYLQGVVL